MQGAGLPLLIHPLHAVFSMKTNLTDVSLVHHTSGRYFCQEIMTLSFWSVSNLFKNKKSPYALQLSLWFTLFSYIYSYLHH